MVGRQFNSLRLHNSPASRNSVFWGLSSLKMGLLQDSGQNRCQESLRLFTAQNSASQHSVVIPGAALKTSKGEQNEEIIASMILQEDQGPGRQCQAP